MGICCSKEPTPAEIRWKVFKDYAEIVKVPQGPACVGKRVMFYVTRVIDGDTLEGHYMTEEGTWVGATIRMAGIDCPENKTVAGQLVTAWITRLLLQHAVWIHLVAYGTYRGRIIAHLHSRSDSLGSLNNYMVRMGLAKPYTGKGRKPGFTPEELEQVVQKLKQGGLQWYP